jgi:hypothetical protein
MLEPGSVKRPSVLVLIPSATCRSRCPEQKADAHLSGMVWDGRDLELDGRRPAAHPTGRPAAMER